MLVLVTYDVSVTEPGGASWRQTIYHPFQLASRYGRGTALQLDVDCASYVSNVSDAVSYLDIAGVHDGDAGTLTFFAINRHGTEPLDINLSMERFGSIKSVEHVLIKHDDLKARNTRDDPDNVAPRRTSDAVVEGNGVSLSVPPYSYSMIRVRL